MASTSIIVRSHGWCRPIKARPLTIKADNNTFIDERFMVCAEQKYFPDLAGENVAPTVLKSEDQASGKCCLHQARCKQQMLEKSVSREDTGHDSA